MSDPQGLYYQQQYEQRRIWEQQQKEKLAQQQKELQTRQKTTTVPDVSGASYEEMNDPNAQMAIEHQYQELNPSPKQTVYRKVPKSSNTSTPRTLPDASPKRRVGTPIFDYSERAERLKMEEQSRQAEKQMPTNEPASTPSAPIKEPKVAEPSLTGGARFYREMPTDSPLVEIPQVSEPEFKVVKIAGRDVKVPTNPVTDVNEFAGTNTARISNIMVKNMGESKGSITAYLRDASDAIDAMFTNARTLGGKVPERTTALLTGEPMPVVKVSDKGVEVKIERVIKKPEKLVDVGVGFVKGAESIVNPKVKSYTDLVVMQTKDDFAKELDTIGKDKFSQFLADLETEEGVIRKENPDISDEAISQWKAENIQNVQVQIESWRAEQLGGFVQSDTAYLQDIKGREGEMLGEVIFDVALAKGLGSAGKAVGLSSKALAAGAVLNVGISQGISYALTGKPIGLRESRNLAIAGAGEAIIGAGVLGAVAKSGVTGERVAQNIAGRAVVNASVDAGIEAVVSKGDAESIARGALFGGVFSAGFDLAGVAVNELRAKLPKSLGGVERLDVGGTTIGSSGQEIPTYVSKEGLPELEGRVVRVVPDVTERPVGFEGVTHKSIVEDYTGKKIATAHATLHGENFDLKAGGKTLLEGFPEQSRGFRKSKELFEFYSAPSDPDVLTIYGGYAGVGEGYSGQPKKVEIGGKATVLTTLDTEISPSFLKQIGEPTDEYLARTAKRAGTTGVSQETVLGVSAERQLSTTTSYVRQGEQLTGSVFESKGKVATVQIKTKGKNILDLPKYTNLDIVLGKYGVPDVGLPKNIVNLESYGKSYGKTVSISQPKALSPSVINISPSLPKTPDLETSPMTSISKETSKAIDAISKSVDSEVKYPSVESVVSEPVSSPPVSLPKYKPSETISELPSTSPSRSVPSSLPKYSPPSEFIPSGYNLPSSPPKSPPRSPPMSSPPSELSEYPSSPTRSPPSRPPSSLSPSPISPTYNKLPKMATKRKDKLDELWEIDLKKQKLKYPVKSAKQITRELSKSFKKAGKRKL